MTLRPGSKIRYLLADRGVHAMGFIGGTETPDAERYEEMLREAGRSFLPRWSDKTTFPRPAAEKSGLPAQEGIG